jgi:hypothetical protein
MSNPTNLEVANTILAQLGGAGRLRMMTSAKDFLGDDKSLSFRIGKNARGVNKVKVTLNPSDTYTVEVFRVRAGTVKALGSASDVYAESLVRNVEALTGLYLTL